MIEEIVQQSLTNTFDFREFAHPDDPLQDLFEEWVPHYRLKHAIAAILQPRSILEIGVRYGYSAVAFLSACRSARYLGIDDHSDGFGGVRGNLEWAKKITQPFEAHFLRASTQKLTELPGGEYDLVHIDGQQDGQGTYHDLWIALDQARYILLGGFSRSEENYRSACQFLIDRKDELDYYSVIPACAGQLLIRVSNRYRRTAREYRRRRTKRRSTEIRGAYTAGYYLHDCGGHETFRATGGKKLQDLRLRAVFDLASPRAGSHFLDAGCGRGELAYQAAKKGALVTAVDYSPDAIRLAQECFAGEEGLQQRVEFICGDVTELALEPRFDRVVAADVVEHLHPEELDELLRKLAAALSPAGRLVIHTAPSLWYLRRGHASRRQRELARGRFLPRNPDTAYEKLMHLNVLSPAVLRRRLREHFAHSVVWVSGLEDDLTGSLSRRYSRREYLESREVFAVASHELLDVQELIGMLRQEALKPGDLRAQIRVRSKIRSVDAGTVFEVAVVVDNHGPRSLATRDPAPVRLSYHWISGDGRRSVVWDGKRTALPCVVLPGESVVAGIQVTAPDNAGRYRLQLSLVQEGVLWFEEACPELPVELELVVREGRSAE